MIQVHWAFGLTETVSSKRMLPSFIDHLHSMKPQIAEISATRIVFASFSTLWGGQPPIIIEGSENEMAPLVTIAGWYVEAKKNPTFFRIKSRSDYSVGIPPAELSAN